MKKFDCFTSSHRRYRQNFLALKFMIAFLAFMFTDASAGSYGQTITYSGKNVKLETIFKEIKKQTGYAVFTSTAVLEIARPVTVRAKDLPLEQFLTLVLRDQPLEYALENKTIIISRKKTTATLSPDNNTSDVHYRNIEGRVTNGEGQPLPGATVSIKGSGRTVVTDEQGRFTFRDLAQGQHFILVVSYVGYTTTEVAVGEQNDLAISLKASIRQMDETVVIGYGTQRKVDLTGSVASVSGTDLTKIGTGTTSTSFAGRMPGVVVTQESGAPGAAAGIKIRGIGSLNSENNPLVLIDGFQGDLNTVAPGEIESISVLKDAASAAIYGSRAANGVILVTTKKGRKNQPFKLSLTAKTGIQQASHLPELLSTQQWIEKENQMGTAYWQPGTQTDPKLQATDFDWMDFVFRSAKQSDYSVSATGGSGKLAYAVNLGYFNQDGIITGENFQRANFRTNLEYTGDNFSLGANIASFKTWFRSTVDRNFVIQDIFRTPPTIAAYNPDGTISSARDGFPGEATEGTTPAMDAAARQFRARSNTSTVNLFGELNLVKGLKFRSVLNLRTKDDFDQTFTNLYQSYKPDGSVGRGNNIARFRNGENYSFVWETQELLTYKWNKLDHHFDVLLGTSAQKETYNWFNVTKNGYTSNNLVSIDAGANLESAGGSQGTNSLISQFGRLNYNYKSKYLFQANVRRDGSSAFAPGHRYGTFPSASAAWKISEEKFMGRLSWLSNLKLRAGYGSLGNQGIPPFRWLGLMEFQRYVFNNAVVGTAEQAGVYNPNISWEKTSTLNLGLDLGLWHRLNLSAEIFNRKTTDMLVELPVPQTSGGGLNPFYNLGAVTNKGWELSATYDGEAGALKYGISFNISHVKNNVDALASQVPYVDKLYQNSTYARTQAGQPIGSYYGYIVDGIWNKAEDAAKYVIRAGGSQLGDFHYRDVDHNDTIDARDRVFLGNPFPRYSYGGNISLAWKNFDLDILVQGVFHRELFVTPEYGLDMNRYYYSNIYREVYNKTWLPTRQDAIYPKLGSPNNSGMNSTWLQDASYLRVKNIMLSYTIPDKWIARAHLTQVRIFASATNLLTITKYVGFDPEMDRDITYGGADYPQAKVVSGGVNIVF